MPVYDSHDPRRYVLVVMTLGLVGMVPLTFGFVTLMPYGEGAEVSTLSVVLWLLLGVAIAALFVATMVYFVRCIRLEERDHPSAP